MRHLLSLLALPSLSLAALQASASSSAQLTSTLFSTSTMTITRTLVSAGHTETITSAIASAPANSPSTPASSAPAPVVTLSSVILSSTVTAVGTAPEPIGTSSPPYQISGGSNATVPLGSGTGAAGVAPTKGGPPIATFTGAAAPVFGCGRWLLVGGVAAVVAFVVAL